MVEIDPIVLFTLGSLFIGLTGIISFVIFSRGNNKSSGNDGDNSKRASKPKKKSRSKAKANKPKQSGYTSSDFSQDEAIIKRKGGKKGGKSNNGVALKPVEEIKKSIPVVEEDSVDVYEEEEEEEEVEEEEEEEEEVVVAPPPPPPAPVTKKAKKEKAPPPTQVIEQAVEDPETAIDGWAVKEKKVKKKDLNDSIIEDQSFITQAPVEEDEKAEGEEDEDIEKPPVDFVSEELVVETRKLGLLIGPKGVTRIGIQNITGAEIFMSKTLNSTSQTSVVTVKGTAAAVKEACVAMKELCAKGYAQILVPADFVEGSVTVHHKFLPDIIGKGGSCVKAIQTATGVKISIPSVGPKTPPPGLSNKVKINVAGLREQVSIARKTILELTKYYHTEMTHPGVIHEELDIPESYYSYIIGPKGAEVKNIQATCKVSVHIPNDESFTQNILVVGEPSNVAAAKLMVKKVVERVENIAIDRAAAEAAELAKWGPGATARSANNSSNDLATEANGITSTLIDEAGGSDEQWMKSFS